MPTLDWIGKKEVVEHHKHVPFRLLKCNESLSAGEPDSGNMLIQGDNLEALKALLPYYKGKVKCIYIDPPYNTGNENWIYNDNVNSPYIREWLGKVVGNEDLSRHDKWLCMMYPRLLLLRELLCEEGVLFLQIGDEEVANIRLLLDEIFGESNYRNSIIVRRGTKNVQSQFDTIDSLSVGHDTILMYSKSPGTRFPKLQHELEKEEAGKWDTFWRGTDRPTMRYELFGIIPDKGQWRWSEERGKKAAANYQKYLKHYNDRMSLDEYYSYVLTSKGEKLSFVRLGPDNNVQYYVPPRAYKLMSNVWMDVRTRGTFMNYPTEKHIELLERIIKWITLSKKNDYILDSFAGSGSTGHAVMNLNKKDSGNRHFILIEMEAQVCQTITVKRQKTLISGDTSQSPKIEALGGGFRYFELGDTLFTSDGRIRGQITFEELARHVFFCETNTPLPEHELENTPLLGVHNDVAVYLLYNGILWDKTPNGGNALTRAVLQTLPYHAGTKVIYGTSCRLSPHTLKEQNIIFRQIPYEVKIS